MNYLVPRDRDGSLVNHPIYAKHVNVKWVDPDPFLSVLQVHEWKHRRSGISVVWKDVFSGATYHMTFKNFEELFNKPVWQGNFIVDGKWQPYKTGDYYNIKFVEE